MTGLQRDCQVRVSLVSNIRYPDYQIEDFIYDDDAGQEVKIAVPVRIFRGRTHKEYDYENNDFLIDWSGKAMHYSEIQQLLDELRKAGGP
ncbi:hypothetical protein HFO49_10530 [Rhizobium leguminosarum]|uniref:hypothetical protein n=1 Tax=Rhizobium leguminosarum TaxID=384 RepID=UPI001C9781CE|nr:hypothetical protein [Rhizobium leguminosarum]MBY5587911.1 hypothetical protein [Rhizobium leguminosarum]MBY5605202.1 hypothetical protein [Rhizobium leguminosarum]